MIHIGAGTLVREEDVIGYFDMDGRVDSAITKEFLKCAEKNGRCVTAGTDLPRSFVLCAPTGASGRRKRHNAGGAKERVIFTHISTQALKKR